MISLVIIQPCVNRGYSTPSYRACRPNHVFCHCPYPLHLRSMVDSLYFGRGASDLSTACESGLTIDSHLIVAPLLLAISQCNIINYLAFRQQDDWSFRGLNSAKSRSAATHSSGNSTHRNGVVSGSYTILAQTPQRQSSCH